jgi:two-component system phosphate regulon response regulator OmpR
MDKKTIIIDDDIRLQELLKEYLEGYGFQVISKMDGDGVVDAIHMEKPDIIVLDIMLPGKDGFDVLKEVRAASSVPVIMLTARGDDTDRIVGLEMGADDYLTKPFNPRELLARMKAILRRLYSEEDDRGEKAFETTISAGGLILHRTSHTLSCGDRSVELSTTELRILEALMKHPNAVLSRDEIMNFARGRDFMAFERSIDVHISKLRSKVEFISGSRDRIKTIWGSGYMFVDGS